MDALTARVEELFVRNRRTTGGNTYTIPSPELYPFQWLWDSCFHAIILSHIDPTAAQAELRSVCARPLPNGLLPHIIYWQYDTSVSNWGREQRGDAIVAVSGVQGTSAITQPPILAYALARVVAKTADHTFLAELYPAVRRYYDALLRERMHPETGLALIINPDESGEDNSPRFDIAQGLALHHSAEESLTRRIDRMREFANCRFSVHSCMAKRFAIADVSFNVLLAESLKELSVLAEILGNQADARRYKRATAKLCEALRPFAADDFGTSSFDVVRGERIVDETWTRFMPLYGSLLSQQQAKKLVADVLLDPDQFWTPYAVPSVSKRSAAFDPDGGFWRGPVWMATNWFVFHGLTRYGFHHEAAVLRQQSLALLERSGFREHYHPITGEGLGAHDFTWGALVLDMQ